MSELQTKIEEVKQDYDQQIQEERESFNERIDKLRSLKRKEEDRKEGKISEIREERKSELKQIADQELRQTEFFDLSKEAIEKYNTFQDLVEQLEETISNICSKVLDKGEGKRVTESKRITIKDDYIYAYGKKKRAKLSLTKICDKHKHHFKSVLERFNMHDECAKLEEIAKLDYDTLAGTPENVHENIEGIDGKTDIKPKTYYNKDETKMRLYSADSYIRSDVTHISTDDYYNPHKISIVSQHLEDFIQGLREYIQKQETANEEIQETLDRCDNVVQLRTAQGL